MPRLALLAALLLTGCATFTSDGAAPAPVRVVITADWPGFAPPGEPQVSAAQAPVGVAHDTTSLVDPERRAQLQAQLDAAFAAHALDPDDEDALIWLGRRLAYLGRYRDAVAVYSAGLQRHPSSARLLRHRGHRLITLMQFDDAVADLSRAAQLVAGTPDEIEPDGAPNASSIPRSTLHSNIDYHLGLAHFLRGDWPAARAAYERGYVAAQVNDDMLVAMSWWLYLTLRVGGDAELAPAVLLPIRANMDVLENHAYLDLLLMARGELTAEQVLDGVPPGSLEFATRGYGVAQVLLQDGQVPEAVDLLFDIVESNTWPSFGAIAAEIFLGTTMRPSDLPAGFMLVTDPDSALDARARMTSRLIENRDS